MRNRTKLLLAATALGASLALLTQYRPAFLPEAAAQSGSSLSGGVADAEQLKSSPRDAIPYTRPLAPEDFDLDGRFPMGATTQGFDPGWAILGTAEPGIFMVDVVVNNTNPNLTNTDVMNDGEVSIAVNPSDPDEVVIAAFSGGWGATAPIYHTLDGGLTWTRQGVPAPNGIPVTGPNDWAWDYGRNNDVYTAVLNNSDIITGVTTDPATAGVWQWNDVLGVTQITNQVAGINGNEDQPWLLVNPDTTTPAQDNVYVAYDDFDNTDGVDGVDMRVAVSYGLTPPDFSAAMGGSDVQVGNSVGGVNPGLRMAEDPRTGYMWALFGRNVAAGAGGSKNMDYMLNRTTDSGATWGLNGSAFGIIVANADSTQPWPKFGTVNALLGGVHHASVDPNTGDLYYAYGNRDAATGNDRLAMRRVFGDGAGGVIVGAENFITGQVEAAIPVVEVADNGTVGVFYYTFDGFSADDFPIYTAHFALSEDKGVTFTTHRLLTFLSSAKDSGAGNRQRVLGDYHQMQSVGNCFYGGFTANGAPFGRPVANHDPIFFKTCVGPQIQVSASLDFAPICSSDAANLILDVCSTGTENLIVENITSSNPEFAVVAPSSGFPVTISPDFCFPFSVAFAPTSAGDHNGTLTVLSDDPASSELAVQVTGSAGNPDMTATLEAGGDFGDVAVGSSNILNLEVLNESSVCGLRIDGLARLGGATDFSFAGLADGLSFPVSLPASSNIDLPIQFEPTIFGPQADSFRLTTDDAGTPVVDFAVAGDSPAPDIAISGDLAFGAQCVGPDNERTIEVCNVAELNSLEVTSASLGACDDFEIVGNPFPATVSHDFCVDMTVRYTPTEVGDHMCTLTIASNDPDESVVEIDVSGSTPAPSISVAADQAFPPTVIQSIGPGKSNMPFPITNTGACDVDIVNVAVSVNPDEYSLPGLPLGLPITLAPGEQVGDGALQSAFEPLALDRDAIGEVTVTWETDPITEATADEMVALCGEGVHTGARVLVVNNGVPVDEVKQIKLWRIGAKRNGAISLVDSVDVARDVPLTTVTPDGVCAPFAYHREYGTVSNPIQLLPGAYLVRATARVDGGFLRKNVGFSVDTTDFNQTIVIEMQPTS